MSTEQTPEEKKESFPPSQLKISRKSVMNYLLILFAAAFCLMLLTYLMERRTTETQLSLMSGYMDDIIDDKGTVEEQRNSLISALATTEAEVLHLEEELADQAESHQQEIDLLEDQLEEANATIAALELALAAMENSENID